jgi:hypothetical protein
MFLSAHNLPSFCLRSEAATVSVSDRVWRSAAQFQNLGSMLHLVKIFSDFPYFRRKNGVSVKNHCYDPFFEKNVAVLSKNSFFSPNFYNIGP